MDFSYTPLEKLFPKRGILHEYNPGKCCMTIEFSHIANDILEAEVREDDVWLICYPRVGATWCQEIMWLIKNDLNFDLALSAIQHLRFPKLEISSYINGIYDKSLGVHSVEYINNMQSPRLIKTNLPYELLPKQLKIVKPKIIYLTRNPKDTWCSYYRFAQSFHDFRASFDKSAAAFCQGKLLFGSMMDHCLPFWNKRHDPNLLFLTYEDMRTNTKDYIRILGEFLEKPLTHQQVDKIYDFVSLEKMKNNPAVNMSWYYEQVKTKNSTNTFIYKGLIGGWRNEMSPQVSKMFDRWIAKNTHGTGLKFQYG